MSGHSKWSTIKHKKEVTDIARGKLFSKLARAISVAAKVGGDTDPSANARLRMAIEQARVANMPKVNIERAISRGEMGEALEEVTYEGFGPGKIAVMAEATTDNRNRTVQEIKSIFEKSGGHLAGPGAVSFNFESKGLLVVAKRADTQEQMLKLIDLGVEDIEEVEDSLEVYVEVAKLGETKEILEKEGFKVTSSGLVQKPKTLQTVTDPKIASKALSFLNTLEEHGDIQKVFANLDIPNEIMEKITAVN